MIDTPLVFLSRKPGTGAAAPSPRRPAAPFPVGTQDSPVLPGQKPRAIVAPVPTQPKARRRLGWWEEDWQAIGRATRTQALRQAVTTEDIGKRAPPPVAEAAYSDVIDVNNGQRGLQGPMLKTSLTNREGEPQLRDYVDGGNADFPAVRLEGLFQIVEPQVDREAVAPGFAQFGAVEPYTDIRTLYK